MTLGLWDWLIIALYFVVSAAMGLSFSRRAGRSITQYFLAGRLLPWWLAGTSMVATTFAADTPLVVAGLVARYGVAGNWLWWNGAISGMLTAFFFSRLWRRAGVLTDVEFTELRYGGRGAAALRGFRALYLALPVNLLIMGWITRAMVMILQISLHVNAWTAIVLLLGLTGIYTMVSGLWGVTLTGSFQFVVAMTACVILAIFAVTSVGGLTSLVLKAENHFGSHDIAFGIFPSGQETWLPLSTLFIFLSVQWWAAWYPGAEPGGGGYIAQRIMACRDEKQSVLATLWFNVAHYAIRPWPWILVGLVGVLRYPHLQNPEEGYVRAMVDLLPSPFQGLMLAGFAAAYMSAISSHLNWGASYLVNDVYLRFINRTATPRAQIFAARIATASLVVLMIGVFKFLGSVEQGWRLLFSLGAGTGAVLILRWYWWRINAWSEISAMAASLVTSVVMHHWRLSTTDALGKDYAIVMATTVAVTTIVWLMVTLLTPPESTDTLNRFYRRVRPGGAGWRTIAKWAGFKEDTVPGGVLAWANWAGGVVGVYGLVFGIGELLTGSWLDAALCLAAAAAGFLLIRRNLALDESLSASVDTPPTPA